MINTILQAAIQYNQAGSPPVSVERAAGQARPGSSQAPKGAPGSLATVVTISEEARRMAAGESEATGSTQQATGERKTYSPEELKKIDKMQQRDREVRAHEMAHVVAGGTLVRKGASFSYETGPDGIRYAVNGEVSIDASPVEDDPEATILKMQHVRRAALAPAQPSGQDRSVASSASKAEATARAEMNQQNQEEDTK